MQVQAIDPKIIGIFGGALAINAEFNLHWIPQFVSNKLEMDNASLKVDDSLPKANQAMGNIS